MENKIEVYHFNMKEAYNTGISYLINPKVEDVKSLLDKGLYKKVATVTTDDLEYAFELTNHIDKSWLENDGVQSYVLQARSTSVGDLCIKNGEVFVVSGVGFQPMPAEFKELLERDAEPNLDNNLDAKKLLKKFTLK